LVFLFIGQQRQSRVQRVRLARRILGVTAQQRSRGQGEENGGHAVFSTRRRLRLPKTCQAAIGEQPFVLYPCSCCNASVLLTSPRLARMRSTSRSTSSSTPALVRTLRYSTVNAHA